MASWIVERAIRFVQQALNEPANEYLTMADLGIEPVRIGLDF